MKWLDKIPFPTLIIIAILLGLAPFSPQPHLVEKLQMLFDGTLSKPIDIFDLVLHGAPLVLLIVKTVHHYTRKASA
ncbi:MAG: RND transporter [Thiohalophilus sp.]|uniref:RND transporter n=1 Tax=Thiohalophilus sp. TaxID=3028392 RepID=UPI0028706892|nr:RND transporter [Thiohalophilus sp.]MDR9437863.1 RND transporter [Thiohalophilus sp.]